VAAARALLELGRAAEAHEFSSRAVAMLDRVWPVEFSPFEARLAHLETMGASDRPGRREAAECVAKSLLHLAAEHVPQAHRGGFLRGHPVHRKILRLAGMERWAGSG
jgi:hypothetical protein